MKKQNLRKIKLAMAKNENHTTRWIMMAIPGT